MYWAWGDNGNGQLGDGTRENQHSPIWIMDGVVAVSAGWRDTMAIRTDDGLWAWGNNVNSWLGDGTMEERRSPVQIMDDVAAVSVWLSHTMAITTDGGLWAWGNNERGQLGDGTDREQHSPMRIMDDVIAVSAGSGNTLAVRADGSLWFWGNDWIAQPGDEITVTIETPVTFERNQGNSHAFFAFIMLSAIRVAWFVTTIPIILLTLAALGGIVLLIRYLRRRK